MAGQQITLDGVSFTDLSLPKLKLDPSLPEAGALMLIDPTHPVSPWAAGVPGAGGIPNVAKAQAALALGVAQSAVETFAVADDLTAKGATVGKMERTPMGGLHGIVSLLNDASGDYWRGLVPAALGAFLDANREHDLYISCHGRITRPVPLNGTGFLAAGLSSGVTAWAVAGQSGSSGAITSYPTGATRLAVRSSGSPTAGQPFHTGAAFSAAPGSFPAGPPTTVLRWGPNTGTSTVLHKMPSWVLYRFYMEDLTVSGRSFATVDALEWAWYQKHVLTAGGRYFGDTVPTDPATIP